MAPVLYRYVGSRKESIMTRREGYHREQKLKRRYGMTQEDFDKMSTEQGDVCWICGEGGKLVVDHCHTEGVVRGLLCSDCNVGLGYFKDNTTALKRAAAYLKRFG